jgi:transposase
VYEVNPRWTALGRRYNRKQDKNDRLDARSVALIVWREKTDLPEVVPEDETAIVDMLVKEREDAVSEATRLRNQIHQLLLHLDPEYKAHLPKLNSKAGIKAAESYTTTSDSAIQLQRAMSVRRLGQRLRLAIEQAGEIARQIKGISRAKFSVLTELSGVDLLTAGALAGILGPGQRFRTDAQLSAYGGAAPLETSSAGLTRHRLNRGGNRRLNAILYRIVLTQSRCSDEAKAYLKRRISQGKTQREAMRALKRYIVRAIFRLWQRVCTIPNSAPVQV